MTQLPSHYETQEFLPYDAPAAQGGLVKDVVVTQQETVAFEERKSLRVRPPVVAAAVAALSDSQAITPLATPIPDEFLPDDTFHNSPA